MQSTGAVIEQTLPTYLWKVENCVMVVNMTSVVLTAVCRTADDLLHFGL